MRRVGDDRGSPGRKPRQHQCRPAPQVRGLHHGAAQKAARRNGQHPACRFGLCAQAAKTLGTAEPALKDHVLDAALAVEDYPAAFAALAALRAPIDRFFDEVMVMDKDEQLRDNRLKLLNRFEAVFSGIANIGELARKK